MQRPKLHPLSEAVILLLLAGACYVFFFHGLTSIGLVGPDEPRYAAVSREMYQTGDFITPRLYGIPWFEKPVLLYWAAAIGDAIFGVGELAARLPSAVAATLTLFFLYFVCRRIWGRGTAVWASFILGSSIGYFVFARAGSTDMLLTASLTMALLSFLMGYHAREPERRWWFLMFYAWIGFGVLAKGPVAIALPALSLGAYMLFSWRPGEWMEWYPRYALVTLAIAAPWYIAVTYANGYKFIQVFFINQNFERFTSTVHGHIHPFYYYLPALLMLTLPWTFLLIPALRRTLDRSDGILLSFAIVPIVFFSFSGSKLPGYILPSVPPIVMLIARGRSSSSSLAFRIAVLMEAGTLLAAGIAFGFFGPMSNLDPHVNGIVIVAVTFLMAAVLTAIAFWLPPPVLAMFNLGVMVFLMLVATSFILPRFEATDTMRPWQPALREFISDDEVVYLYEPSRWMEYGMQYYRFNKTKGVFSPTELDSVLGDTDSKVLFVADEKGLADLAEITSVQVQIVKTIGNQSAFWAWETE